MQPTLEEMVRWTDIARWAWRRTAGSPIVSAKELRNKDPS
jgi:hypothetical protein